MENWRDVPGYEGLYRVSDLGRVYSVRSGIILRQADSKGYSVVSLYGNGSAKTVKVHRLVAGAFIPNPENKNTVNHINENKEDNRVCNLEWATEAEQNLHGTRLARAARSRGREIRQLSLDGELIRIWSSAAEATRALGLSKSAIWPALAGKYKQAGGFIWERSFNT